MGEVGEWNGDVRVVWDETPVEISKTEERLYIFNLLRFRPILNDLCTLSAAMVSPLGERI